MMAPRPISRSVGGEGAVVLRRGSCSPDAEFAILLEASAKARATATVVEQREDRPAKRHRQTGPGWNLADLGHGDEVFHLGALLWQLQKSTFLDKLRQDLTCCNHSAGQGGTMEMAPSAGLRT